MTDTRKKVLTPKARFNAMLDQAFLPDQLRKKRTCLAVQMSIFNTKKAYKASLVK